MIIIQNLISQQKGYDYDSDLPLQKLGWAVQKIIIRINIKRDRYVATSYLHYELHAASAVWKQSVVVCAHVKRCTAPVSQYSKWSQSRSTQWHPSSETNSCLWFRSPPADYFFTKYPPAWRRAATHRYLHTPEFTTVYRHHPRCRGSHWRNRKISDIHLQTTTSSSLRPHRVEIRSTAQRDVTYALCMPLRCIPKYNCLHNKD